MNSSAPPEPEIAVDAPVVDPSLPSGAPYRAVDLAIPVLSPLPPSRRPHPLIGPALGLYAVLLWAFVVVGQFATSWSVGAPLGQGPALLLVAIVTLGSWVAHVRNSHAAQAPSSSGRFALRAIVIAVVAFFLFGVTIVAATAAGRASWRNHDLAIAFALVVVSLIAAVAAPRLSSPDRPTRTHRMRVAVAVLWIAGLLVTFVAGADLVANG